MAWAAALAWTRRPAGIDEAHARAQPVQGIGQRRALGGLEIEHSGDQNRAADVGDDQAHALAHLVIDDAIALVAKHSEHRHAGGRLVEGTAGSEVDQALLAAPTP